MATFRMSQCQDGDEVLNVMNEDARVYKDALENLNTQKSTSRRILTGILSKNSKRSREWSSRSIRSRARLHKTSVTTTGIRTRTRNLSQLHEIT